MPSGTPWYVQRGTDVFWFNTIDRALAFIKEYTQDEIADDYLIIGCDPKA